MGMINNLSGLRVGFLKVITWAEKEDGNGNYRWLCECDCGGKSIVRGQYLSTERTISCGCLMGNTQGKPVTSPENYLAVLHNNIKQRCYNENNVSYKHYGDRGIELYDGWMCGQDFIAGVLEEIGEKPTPDHSFDRIDNNGNYEPGNVKWSTAKEQANNTRRSRTKQ